MINMKLVKVFLYFLNPKSRARLLKLFGLNIGNNCHIYRDVSFGSEPYLIKIGDNVRITDGVRFVNHDGGVWVLRGISEHCNIDIIKPITIGSNVHIGINSIIMPGVTIGDNVVIGAGSIVTRNIHSNSIAAGVPARVIKTFDEYLSKSKIEGHSTKNLDKQSKENFYKNHYK